MAAQAAKRMVLSAVAGLVAFGCGTAQRVPDRPPSRDDQVVAITLLDYPSKGQFSSWVVDTGKGEITSSASGKITPDFPILVSTLTNPACNKGPCVGMQLVIRWGAAGSGDVIVIPPPGPNPGQDRRIIRLATDIAQSYRANMLPPRNVQTHGASPSP